MPTWPAVVAFFLVLLVAWSARTWLNGAWTERAEVVFETTATSVETEIRDLFEHYGTALASAQRIIQLAQLDDESQTSQMIDDLFDGMGLPEFLGIGLVVPVDRAGSMPATPATKTARPLGVEPSALPFQLEILEGQAPVSDFLISDATVAAFGDALALSREKNAPTGSALFWLQKDLVRAPSSFLVVHVDQRANSTGPDDKSSWVAAVVDLSESLKSVGDLFARDITLTLMAEPTLGSEEAVSVAEQIASARFSRTVQIEFYGLDLDINFTSTSQFEYENSNPIARFQVAMSIFVSLLVAQIVQMITVQNRMNRAIIAKRTRELETREREINSILQTALVGIVTLDAAGHILFLNPQAQQILQLTETRARGLVIKSVLPDLDLRMLHQKLAYPQGATGQDLRMLEIGCTHWEEDHKGERVTLILHDVTDEHRAQLDLRESRQRWDRAMTNSAIGVFDIDLRTNKSVVSTGWLLMMGVENPPKNFDPQKHFEMCVLEDDMPKVARADTFALDGKADRSVSEYRMMIPGLGLRWMRSEAVVTLDEATGKPIHFSGTQHDITETKLAQEALIASEERFRSAFDRSPTCNVLLDRSFRVTQINRAMHELLNTRFRLEGVAADPATMFAEHWPRIKQALMDLQTEGDVPYRTEIELERAGSRSLWLDVNASIIRDPLAEGPTYFLQIFDSSKLRLVDQVKSELIATVSHEMRTPVTSIKGATDLLGSLPSEHRTATENRLLDILARNATRLTELISDILDLEAVQSGMVHFDFKELLVARLVDEIKVGLLPYADHFSVTIRDESIDPDATIHADHRRAYQCLSNLVSNACKFSEPFGVIRIRIENSGQNRIRIDVINKGAGIPREFEDRLFSAFARVDSSDTRDSGGTGLGLKITKELMEKMNGSVSFRRGAEGETIFSLEFMVSANADNQSSALLN